MALVRLCAPRMCASSVMPLRRSTRPRRRPATRSSTGPGSCSRPGFIDVHNHSTDGLATDREAASQVSQGITTVLVGPDGSSPPSIADYLAARRSNPATVNVATLVGHATVRQQVMGDDYRRTATPAEVERMAALVDRAMLEGALGLSSGLEYVVGSYASTDEVVAVATAAARRARHLHFAHSRRGGSDDRGRAARPSRSALGARLPVQITHIKLGTVGVWGKAADVVAIVEAARRQGIDVMADAYPYLAWQSNLKVLVPNKQYTDPASVKEALDDVGGGQEHPVHAAGDASRSTSASGRARPRRPRASARWISSSASPTTRSGIIGHTMSEPDLRDVLPAAVGDGGQRRRRRQQPPARGRAPSRACWGVSCASSSG